MKNLNFLKTLNQLWFGVISQNRILSTLQKYTFCYKYLDNKLYNEVLKSHNMKVKTDLT
jgi:hypothetical protein